MAAALWASPSADGSNRLAPRLLSLRLAQRQAEQADEQTAAQEQEQDIHPQEIEPDDSQPHCQRPACLEHSTPQAPDRLGDDRDHDRLNAIEKPIDLGQRRIGHIGPGHRQHDQHGRGDEANAAQHQPWPAGAQVAEVDGQFGRGRPGNEIGDADHVDELGFADPFAALHDLGAHHGDVGRGAAEAGDAQAQEDAGDLEQAVDLFGSRNWCVWSLVHTLIHHWTLRRRRHADRA